VCLQADGRAAASLGAGLLDYRQDVVLQEAQKTKPVSTVWDVVLTLDRYPIRVGCDVFGENSTPPAARIVSDCRQPLRVGAAAFKNGDALTGKPLVFSCVVNVRLVTLRGMAKRFCELVLLGTAFVSDPCSIST